MLVCFSSKMAKGTYWFFLVVVWSTRHLAPSHPALSLFLFCFCFVFDFVFDFDFHGAIGPSRAFLGVGTNTRRCACGVATACVRLLPNYAALNRGPRASHQACVCGAVALGAGHRVWLPSAGLPRALVQRPGRSPVGCGSTRSAQLAVPPVLPVGVPPYTRRHPPTLDTQRSYRGLDQQGGSGRVNRAGPCVRECSQHPRPPTMLYAARVPRSCEHTGCMYDRRVLTSQGHPPPLTRLQHTACMMLP
mmetsp:Transcript_49816/g.117099  ORF Transcript_49816/g.117099 Transcript_49816/m.117099 type:complete len:247 (+) Transcript_49816:150-890(+)